MKEIDWSKAPADATHYNQFARIWIKHLGNGSYQFLQGEEWSMGFGCMDSRYIERPKPEAWSGEGLLPVGTVCEALWNTARDEWFQVKIFGANEHGQPVFRWEDGPEKYQYQASTLTGPMGHKHFRPLRTPEQIAAEEREKEVDALCSDIVSHYEAPKMSEHYLGLAKALHAAGYRKVTP